MLQTEAAPSRCLTKTAGKGLEWGCIGQASCLEFHVRDLVREQRRGVPGRQGNNHLVNVGRVLAVLMMAVLTHGS